MHETEEEALFRVAKQYGFTVEINQDKTYNMWSSHPLERFTEVKNAREGLIIIYAFDAGVRAAGWTAKHSKSED